MWISLSLSSLLSIIAILLVIILNGDNDCLFPPVLSEHECLWEMQDCTFGNITHEALLGSSHSYAVHMTYPILLLLQGS